MLCTCMCYYSVSEFECYYDAISTLVRMRDDHSIQHV